MDVVRGAADDGDRADGALVRVQRTLPECLREFFRSVHSQRTFPLKRRAANKPDSVHPLAGTPIIHLSGQPGTSWSSSSDASRAGSAFGPLFDLAPERVCLVTRRFSRAGGLLPRLFTVAEFRRTLRCLFLWHFPSRRFARRPRPVKAGFPPCGVRTFLCLAAATGHSHVASGEIFKDRPTKPQAR